MSAAELIRRATDAGVEMQVGRDGRLLLRAKREPSADLLADLTANKAELVERLTELGATNDPHKTIWLHLLVLDDGSVIQRCGEQATVLVDKEARLRFGDHLQDVVAVSGYERPLTEEEIAKALAGTLASPAALPPPSGAWLARVARLLGARPAELLAGRHLEQHDLVELAGSDAAQVAKTLLNSPAWINRPRPVEQLAEHIVEEKPEEQRFTHTAATATPAWREARDYYINHLMVCRACYAQAKRYCPIGSDLRQNYNDVSAQNMVE
ncbi:hypothetical protein [Atopomonas sediminilitoris]|uniref:hypothetical protein n=1 Tax=Atopomonas sediminilitoris TaxID=2919919 RepID=UPI001F4E6B40|nr:hypothetical protein [Atopomonas sediminilitoris]MCJ8167688.1 hypothetical protein [Atopomonas sediminilitoris]